MRFIGIFTAFIMIVCILTSCVPDRLNDVFGVDVSSAEVISDVDTHGGFHGDGERFLVLKFSDESVEDQIKEAFDWQPLPTNEAITAVIWGIETESGSIGPFTAAEIPKVKNGWFGFSDRTPDINGSYPDGLFAPQNFTFAVYDADSDIMYIVESDS